MKARSIADVTSGIILATVDIKAPPERVFAALTEAADITKWWGSADMYQTTSYTADLRVGGKWRAEGNGASGPFFVEGEFLEIDRPRKLVQTWCAPWDGGNRTTITYVLEPIESGTRVALRHEGFAGRPDSCRDHGEGWERVLGWLGGHLMTPDKAFFARLVPPRPSFMFDSTDAENAVMKEHFQHLLGHHRAGRVPAFGPVAEPNNGWGMAIVRAADEAAARALLAEDPVIRSGLGFRYDVMPMPSSYIRG